MVDEIKTFEERKKELVAKGKEKGFVTYEELAAALKGLDLDADSLDDLYNAFNENNIEVYYKGELVDNTVISLEYISPLIRLVAVIIYLPTGRLIFRCALPSLSVMRV